MTMDLDLGKQAQDTGILEVGIIKLFQIDPTIEQGNGNAIREAMIRCFPVFGEPFFFLSANDVHRGVKRGHINLGNVLHRANFRTKLEGHIDSALRVILGRPEFDAGAINHEVIAFTAPVTEFKRPGDLLFKTHFPIKDMGRAGHTVPGQSGSKHRISGRIGKGGTFPVRELAHTSLTHGHVRDASEGKGMTGFVRCQLEDFRCCQGGRKSAVGDMIPSSGSDAGGITQATLDFVGNRDSGNDLLPGGHFRFSKCEDSGNVVAGVRGLEGEVGIVVIEVTEKNPVGKGGHFRGGLVKGTDDG